MGFGEKGEILVVDDTPQTLQLLVAILTSAGYTVRPADSGALALASVETRPPDLILLDVKMPQMSGFDVCRQLKQNPATLSIPVIFLSGLTDLDERVQGFQLGAVDFVTKPFQREELLARVKAHLELARLQNELANEVSKQTRDLQTAYQELAKASQMKDEFLSTMSHELRTPLTAILGMAEILNAGAYGSLNQEQADAVDVIERSGRKLLQIINEILDYIQLDSGQVELQLEEWPIVDLVNSVLENVRSKAEQRQIKLSSRFYQHDQQLWLDVRHMRRVLMILLDNAVKFTPSGGSVGIIVRNSIIQRRIEFEVWDSGPGIAEADLPKLFKPFLQLDAGLNRIHEGSGLGLALAGKLARLLGGEIRVTSRLNEGSRFIVSLPQARGRYE